jgi:hypothetical protein
MKLTKYFSFKNISVLLFTTGSLLFFSFFYYHHLWQREQLQLFLTSPAYFLKCISSQGGFSIWLGEFFTQFLSVPFAGAVIISVLLLLLQKSAEKLLAGISENKNLAIFSLLPSLDYFFLLTQQYYYLSGLTGLILSVIASAYYVKGFSGKSRIAVGILLIAALYWLTGAAFLVFAFNIIICELVTAFKHRGQSSLKSAIMTAGCYLAAALIVPLIARKFIITDTLLQSYISEAYYTVRIFLPLPLILELALVPLLLVVQAIIPDNLPHRKMILVNVVFTVAAAGLIFCGFRYSADFREEREMAYENMTCNREWNKIVKYAERHKPEDQKSMVAVNLALAETGQLPEKMFQFSQGKNSLFMDYVRKGMTPFVAGDTYYFLGLVNFAQMFAVETIESTVDAKLPVRSVKRAAETYLLNGQYDVARKYLTLAKHTLFYRKWAEKYLDLIDSGKNITDDPVLKSEKELMPDHDFFYDYQKMDVALKYLLISNPGNTLAAEYLMAHYLLNKDFDGFLQNLGILKRINSGNLPVVCQEAIAYILTRMPEAQPELQAMVTDPAVIERLQAYARMFSTSRQDTLKMKKEFGGTYWYYLHYR